MKTRLDVRNMLGHLEDRHQPTRVYCHHGVCLPTMTFEALLTSFFFKKFTISGMVQASS